MRDLVSKILLYRNFAGSSIITNIANAIENCDDKDKTVSFLYAQIKEILDLSTKYGFNNNLWQNYLTFLLISDENSFSLTCERAGAQEGSVNEFAKSDFEIFRKLFHYDFTSIEKELGVDCFSIITNYSAISKRECVYYKNVSEIVQNLSEKLSKCESKDEFFDLVTDHYKRYGVGMFGLNKAFRLIPDTDNVELYPINNADSVRLDDLVGYEFQKKQLVDNTRAFVLGGKGNNALLYGDSGTGKSTSIKAVLNEFYDDGLRMIEIYKYQFRSLSSIISQIKNRNYRFIIYIDDLSFEENEVEYKFLKAVIEGGVETRPENVLIYATSNRRHLIKETWADRDDMEHNGEIHRSDTMEEKLSLSARFGVTINYSSPDHDEYYNIVRSLAKREGIEMEDSELCLEANRWELRHGGVSGRTARQFIDHLAGRRKI